MPKRDVGIFTPTEAAYTRPGTYETAVRAEATKRGTYLSQMDQFYAELETMEKQFGEKLAFEEKRLVSEEKRAGELLEWYGEQETGRLGLERERITSGERIARIGGRAAGRQAVTGGAFEPYRTTSELKGEEEPISMDWLTEQMQRMFPTTGAGTTGATAWEKYSAASDEYQRSLEY